jgi:glycosyltransferase involved in cell wall biosynthesis
MKKKKIKVLHTITRMIVGGACENTMLCGQLINQDDFSVDVLSGLQTGVNGDLYDECKARNVDIIGCPELVREISPIKDIVHFFKMIRFLKKRDYDIIHTHSSKAGFLHRLAAKIAGVPVIIHTIHGWSFNYRMSSWKRQMYILLEKIAAKFTNKLIAVTMFDVEKGLQEGIGYSDQYCVIHSSIEIEKFEKPDKPVSDIKTELGLDHDKIIVGTVSRMDEQKAPLDFMKVAAKILKSNKQVKFLFVGDGHLRKQVSEFLENNKLTNDVILTGIRHDVANMFAVMDIFILTSLWEGLPRVFSQAYAAKLPIVATRVDGASEIIKPELNGFLVAPSDIDDMISKIQRLIDDPELRLRMGSYGYNQISPDFEVNHMIKQIEEVYHQYY